MNKSTFGRITTIAALGLALLPARTNAQNKMTWGQAGPVYAAGRARNMIVDKSNSNVLYIGSASSGLFKSENGGANWAPVNDQGSVRNISYIAQSKNGTIYAATGEGYLRYSQKAKAQPGSGLYKLSGSNLVSVAPASITGSIINRVACSPVNDNVIAITTEKGVLVSIDGGSSFNPATGIPTSSLITGMDVKFDNTGVLYCSAGNERGLNPYSTVNSRVYKSSDASLSGFTDITPTVSVFGSNYGRIELAIAPSNNAVIYASCANKNTTASNQTGGGNSATLKGLFVSYNGGQTWALVLQGSPQLDPMSNGGTLASGDYAHVVTVHPSNPDVIVIGGYYAYVFVRDRNKGSDLNPLGDWHQLGFPFAVNTPLYMHENIHDVKIVPGTPTKWYFVTDAGVFRSTDITNSSSQQFPPSFQPFYKGLITGQFNSVAIERWPATATTVPTAPGSTVSPDNGFIGGTSGSGLTYFSGNPDRVGLERSTGGEVYNAEYMRNLTDGAIFSSASGAVYRISDVKNSDPTIVKVDAYTGPLTKLVPDPQDYPTSGTTGTPFELWENWGQRHDSPDVVIFYNDTIRAVASLSGTLDMVSAKQFTFSVPRPSLGASLDSIVVRSATVTIAATGAQLPGDRPFTNRKTVTIKLKGAVSAGPGVSIASGTNLSVTGPITTSAAPSVTLDNNSLFDNLSMTFDAPPFAAENTGSMVSYPDPSVYYRVFATAYYAYGTGDTVMVVDKSISSRTQTYTAVLQNPLNWSYGTSAGASTFSVAQSSALSNPTFVANPGNITSTTNTFSVNNIGQSSYTVNQYGVYKLIVKPVVYTLTATTDTTVPTFTNGTYSWSITPNSTQPSSLAAVNATSAVAIFTVVADTTTTFTITQKGLSASVDSYSTITGTTYSLTPGSVTQNTPAFNITVTPTGGSGTYTAYGIPSSTLGTATSTTATYPVSSTVVAGSTLVPFASRNPIVRIPTYRSARYAAPMNHSKITGGVNAVVVSRNPLALNDPMEFVRVSQSGVLTDDANGDPSNTAVVTVNGKATVLEWSKSGRELYYATDANELYRVSHITDIFDMSPAFYGGKFYTDVFKYDAAINSNTVNPASPYRTTLLGKFDRQITSISAANDDKSILVTFNGAATTTNSSIGVVCVLTSSATADIRKCNATNVLVSNKEGSFPKIATYCSMIQMDDGKQVFVGTDQGIYYTKDITAASPTWLNVNDPSITEQNALLPNVQVFDIRQQVMDHWDSYNSREIYVATYGRGVWSNSAYLQPYAVAVQEYEPIATSGTGLLLYPNPTRGNAVVAFDGIEGENAVLQVIDITGKTVVYDRIGKLSTGETKYTLETSGLNGGIYMVNIASDSGKRRTGKLVVER